MENNHFEKRISVAIATYNGSKYVEEQIKSIIKQTQCVNEIVISDDGSCDSTLEIVRAISKKSEASKIDFVILSDNPRHGYCGNFEYAISHCTGDYIFLADQDDVWLPDKVESVISVFKANIQLQCVFHKTQNIDKNNIPLSDCNYSVFKQGIITQKDYLEQSVSGPLCAGMVMCISKQLKDTAIPFPQISGLHDQWLMFSALCSGECYYLDKVLTLYRCHEDNETAKYRGSFLGRIKKAKIELKRTETMMYHLLY